MIDNQINRGKAAQKRTGQRKNAAGIRVKDKKKPSALERIRKAIRKRMYGDQPFKADENEFIKDSPSYVTGTADQKEENRIPEKEPDFAEERETEFQPADNKDLFQKRKEKPKPKRRMRPYRSGIPESSPIKTDNKKPHTAEQQKNYRLKREFDPETGKETYRRFFDARNIGQDAVHGTKTAAATGIDFLHAANGEEDDNSATEAAGAGIRTGSRFQDFIYEKNSRRRKGQKKNGVSHKRTVKGQGTQKKDKDFQSDKGLFSKHGTGTRAEADLRKEFQKRQIKRDYAKALRKSRETAVKTAKTVEEAAKRTLAAARKLAELAATHAHVLIVAGLIFILLLIIMTGVSSCAAMFGGGIADVVAGSYQSLPSEIDKADTSMTLKEMELQETIDRIEIDHPGYDEYSYNLAAIGHNPFTLINFLSAKYVEFTAPDVESEIQILFDAMYDLDISDREETRTRMVKKTRKKVDPDTGKETDEDEEYEEEEEYTVKILEVTLTSTPLETVISPELTGETADLYALYRETKGARQEFYTPLDLDWQSYIKSYYGYRKNPLTGARQMHRGVDISVPEGTNVYASQSGTVVTADYDEDYGIYIVIADSGGYMTKYAHLESRSVSTGQTVRHGQLIGKTGSTGSITGSHLHIECLYNGEYYNPLLYFENGEGSLYDTEDPDTPVSGDVEALLNEAKKYLGYPYVWGGSNPSTSFDCSGFVCWVLTNSGFCDMPRTTAQGIYNKCVHINPGDAEPGDLIFFTGTYKSGNPVSHVGIYCGNGVMIHAGDPIKYSNINTPYWQSHFYGYGRIVH